MGNKEIGYISETVWRIFKFVQTFFLSFPNNFKFEIIRFEPFKLNLTNLDKLR